jgi:general secretion pathway protein G
MKVLRRLFLDTEGFTLVELIVVIAVLGILSGIAVPRLTGVLDKAKYATGEALLANLKTPLELYRVENNNYPTTDGDDYDDLETALNEYMGNFSNLLAKNSSDDWYFASYSSTEDSTYTLTIQHSDSDLDKMRLTPSGGIEKGD